VNILFRLVPPVFWVCEKMMNGGLEFLLLRCPFSTQLPGVEAEEAVEAEEEVEEEAVEAVEEEAAEAEEGDEEDEDEAEAKMPEFKDVGGV